VKTPSGAPDPAFDVRFDGAGQRAVAKLARAWERDLDLVRAAAEQGIGPRALKQRLATIDGDLTLEAQRLSYGTVSRTVWTRLQRALEEGETAPVAAGEVPKPETSGGIDVVLWPDSPDYRPRDLVTFSVTVSTACHLTLINVDERGRATVLFPNELDPDNLIAPGVRVRVPGASAGYQLRFDKAGQEDFVAICQRRSRRPDGIVYNHEKQRFAMLGDWPRFLANTSQRMAALNAQAGRDDTSRRRRRNRPSADQDLPAIDPSGPALEGRTAITVEIDLAGEH